MTLNLQRAGLFQLQTDTYSLQRPSAKQARQMHLKKGVCGGWVVGGGGEGEMKKKMCNTLLTQRAKYIVF
jgi:hypothetical protein